MAETPSKIRLDPAFMRQLEACVDDPDRLNALTERYSDQLERALERGGGNAEVLGAQLAAVEAARKNLSSNVPEVKVEAPKQLVMKL